VAISGQNMRSGLANQYGTLAAFAALYSTAGGSTAGTELSGGSPAYARKAPAWGGAGAGNTNTATIPTFDVPSGATVAGGGFHSAVTAGNYMDGGALTSQAFASQGSYTLSASYTQS
jgi:hypothetical protein